MWDLWSGREAFSGQSQGQKVSLTWSPAKRQKIRETALIFLWLVMEAGLVQWDKNWSLLCLELVMEWALLQHR